MPKKKPKLDESIRDKNKEVLISDLGHWIYIPSTPVDSANAIDLSNKAGFTYTIYNKIYDRSYIGCKYLYLKRGKKLKDSKLRTYTGSCIELNKDIEVQGINNFIFTILHFHNTKLEVKYHEAKLIMEGNAIFSDKYYNQFLFLRMRNRKYK